MLLTVTQFQISNPSMKEVSWEICKFYDNAVAESLLLELTVTFSEIFQLKLESQKNTHYRRTSFIFKRDLFLMSYLVLRILWKRIDALAVSQIVPVTYCVFSKILTTYFIDIFICCKILHIRCIFCNTPPLINYYHCYILM